MAKLIHVSDFKMTDLKFYHNEQLEVAFGEFPEELERFNSTGTKALTIYCVKNNDLTNRFRFGDGSNSDVQPDAEHLEVVLRPEFRQRLQEQAAESSDAKAERSGEKPSRRRRRDQSQPPGRCRSSSAVPAPATPRAAPAVPRVGGSSPCAPGGGGRQSKKIGYFQEKLGAEREANRRAEKEQLQKTKKNEALFELAQCVHLLLCPVRAPSHTQADSNTQARRQTVRQRFR